MESAMPVQQSEARSSFVSSSVESKPDGKGVMYLLIAFLVLLILGLGGTVAYLLFFKDTDKEDTNGNNGDYVAQTCIYDGKTYDEGESFDSTDGCNTCTCDDGEVVCTMMSCETSPADPYEGWLTYNFERYEVSFKYPSDWTVMKQVGDSPMGEEMEQVILTDSEGEDIMVFVIGWMGRVGLGTDATGPLSPIGELMVEGKTLYQYSCNDILEVRDAQPNVDVSEQLEGCYRLSVDDLTSYPMTDLDEGWYTYIPGNTTNNLRGFTLLWYGNMNEQWWVTSRNARTVSDVQPAEDLLKVELVIESITGLF